MPWHLLLTPRKTFKANPNPVDFCALPMHWVVCEARGVCATSAVRAGSDSASAFFECAALLEFCKA